MVRFLSKHGWFVSIQWMKRYHWVFTFSHTCKLEILNMQHLNPRDIFTFIILLSLPYWISLLPIPPLLIFSSLLLTNAIKNSHVFIQVVVPPVHLLQSIEYQQNSLFNLLFFSKLSRTEKKIQLPATLHD